MRAGGRWRQQVAAAAACAALLGLAACSPGGKPSPPAGTAVLPAGAPAALGPGTVYLLLGNQNVSANLWRVDMPGGRARQLTFNPPEDGVSNFNASPAGLVLGDARTTVDLAEVMRGAKPRLLGGGIGDSPQISDAGQIADLASAEQGVSHGPWSRDRLLLWDRPSGPYRTIYQAKPGNRGTIAWNPAGNRILLINGPDDNAYTRLFIVSPRGQIMRTLVTLPGAGPEEYAWGPYGLAIGYLSSRPSKILSMSGRVRTICPKGGCQPAGTLRAASCWSARRPQRSGRRPRRTSCQFRGESGACECHVQPNTDGPMREGGSCDCQSDHGAAVRAGQRGQLGQGLPASALHGIQVPPRPRPG
jgi:hypothetical protein